MPSKYALIFQPNCSPSPAPARSDVQPRTRRHGGVGGAAIAAPGGIADIVLVFIPVVVPVVAMVVIVAMISVIGSRCAAA
jgi:hypothetical protein